MLYLLVFFSYDVAHTCALVAQLDRVQVSEAWGRGFDPRRARQFIYNNFINLSQFHKIPTILLGLLIIIAQNIPLFHNVRIS